MKPYILAIGLMLAINFAIAGTTDPNDPVRSKTFSKSFPLDGNDKVELNNRYGEMLIKTWDKKEIRVDIDIKAYSKDEADAQRLIDGTVIAADKRGNLVSVKTNFAADGGKFGSKVINGKTISRREIRVNYIVYMPAANALTLSNQYGNVNMGSFSGPLNVKVQYGSLTAGNLNNASNILEIQYGFTKIQEIRTATIKQQYGSGLNIGTIGSLNLDAQYTGVNIGTIKGDAIVKQQYGPGLDIGRVGNLDLTVQYANVKLGTVIGDANIKQQYNKLSIGSANTLNLKGQYTTVAIGNLKGPGNFSVAYGKLGVEQVGTGCKNLHLLSSYSHVSLKFGSGYQGDFDLRTSYSPFKAGAGVSSKLIAEKGSIKNYAGTIGNGGGAEVTLKADYGSVNLN
ncbi:hypothetical protein [Pedobacter heparinus]|uniref:hypothetical protein n=1 Tax=Pedobacter heparinus TaxID=984 RepID=UPI0029311B42|nr:hypothetical protein [Pedobacter heparinus]